MSGRGAALALAMLGILAGVALQVVVGPGLNDLALVLISIAGALALIVPVIAAMPMRRARMESSPKSRRAVYIAMALALLLAWIIVIAVSMSNDVEWPRTIGGLGLIAITTIVWVISSSSLRRRSKGEPYSPDE
jgi:L-asparagine transporter-like permease